MMRSSLADSSTSLVKTIESRLRFNLIPLGRVTAKLVCRDHGYVKLHYIRYIDV